MGEKRKHETWKFNIESNDIGTDRGRKMPDNNRRVLEHFEDMPYYDLEHQKHRK